MSAPRPSPPGGGSDPPTEGSSHGQSKEQEDQPAPKPEPPRMVPHVQVHVESSFLKTGKPMVPTRLIVPATNSNQTTVHPTQSHKSEGPSPAHSLAHLAAVGGMGHLPLLGHAQPGPPLSRGSIQPHLGTHIPASLPVHGFTSHVPRGAAAAASLTPAAKGSVTTVLRPPSAGASAFPVSTPSVGLVQTQAIPPQVKVQARAVGGSSTPPIITTSCTRTPSPAVTSGPEQHRAAVFPPHGVGLVRGEGTASPHLPTLPPRSLQVSHVIGMPQHKPAVTAATVAPMMAHTTTVTTTVSTQSKYCSPQVHTTTVTTTVSTQNATVTQVSLHQSTSASAVTFSPSSSHSSAVSSASIPIAKVLPQPVAHSPRPLLDYSGDPPGMPASSSLFLPPRQRGSPNPVNTAVSTAAHSDSRPDRSQFLLSHRPPQASLPLHTPPYTTITPAYYYDPAAALRYPHHTAQAAMAMHTYQAAQAAAHFTPISCSASAIRPLVASPQASVAAAAVAVAAQHAGGMRPGPAMSLNHPMFLSMEAARQAQQVPPSITTASEANETSASSMSGSYAGGVGGANTQPVLPVGAPGNPNSSPRPSILRKRTNDGMRRTATATTPTNSDPNSPRVEVAPPTAASPRPAGETKAEAPSSQAGEVAMATEGDSTVVTSEVKVKEEPMEIPPHPIPPGAMTVNQLIASVVQAATTPTVANTASLPATHTSLPPEASPRKKPRKQQHVVATEDGFAGDVELKMMDNKSDFPPPTKKESRDRKKEQVEDVLYVLKRFPRPSLLSSYRHGWKARLNHFQRYSDFKVKDKKASLHDVCSQKGLAQKAAGWKVHHLANQLDELACNEQDTFAKMSSFHDGLKAPGKKIIMEEEMRMIQELIQGNIQRAQLTTEQLNDTKQQMVKIVEKHRGEVCDIIKKNCSRKSSKKKSSS
ncbi:PREDICTED: histone deacetylase complex subunit SAP130-B-like isoform X1 [Branchiostoma belcheri]|uniref:Histone deacetylase complex subunit SAP130-B-like isoform X1 n=1 Tax=Branchiostoma belcheri TaxID=7741 RepID=A0A6P4XT53_BRABE|nr:PREDICTED: histone deacetylase complex subunit SAP130-B-like isoform X1 [Branchiostoma belcheri]